MMATTGERVREIREKRGMTQDQLAGQAKISKSFLSEIENNKRNVSSQALLRIAKILGADAPLEQKVTHLIDAANANGGRDNISVLMAQANTDSKKRGLISRLLGK